MRAVWTQCCDFASVVMHTLADAPVLKPLSEALRMVGS